MSPKRDNALPAGYRTGRKTNKTDKTNRTPLGSWIKRFIVGLAVWGLLPPGSAQWLINSLGLRGA